MDRLTQSILVTLIGGALVALTVSGRFALYVKVGFGPLLLAAGALLVLVGAVSVVMSLRGGARPAAADRPHDRDHDQAPDHPHDHDRSGAAWLLVLPVIALLLAPPALGADAVARTSGSQAQAGAPPPAAQVVTGDGGYAPNDGSGAAATVTTVGGHQVRSEYFPPLPGGAHPEVPLTEFIRRALYDQAGSVTRHPVTVTGFIAPAGEDFTGGYSVAQLIISCCAADARAVRIHVDGAAPFPTNTWVRVVVTAYPGSGTGANQYVPTVAVAAITKVAQPDDPYGR